MLSFPRKKYWDSGFCEGGTLSFQECMGDRFSKDFQKQDVQCMNMWAEALQEYL